MSDVDRFQRTKRTLGAVLAAAGAIGVAASAYVAWYDGRAPTQIPLDRLFSTEAAGDATSYWASMAGPLVLAGLVGVVAALRRSRLGVAVAGLAGVGTLVLWVLMQAMDLSPADLGVADYQGGLWICVASLALLFAGFSVMAARRGARTPDRPAKAPREPART